MDLVVQINKRNADPGYRAAINIIRTLIRLKFSAYTYECYSFSKKYSPTRSHTKL